jgi:hypothetical protein
VLKLETINPYPNIDQDVKTYTFDVTPTTYNPYNNLPLWDFTTNKATTDQNANDNHSYNVLDVKGLNGSLKDYHFYIFEPIFSSSAPIPSFLSNPAESSGEMVFAGDGVFADNRPRYGDLPPVGGTGTLDQLKGNELGNFENQLVTALNRGIASLDYTDSTNGNNLFTADTKINGIPYPKGTPYADTTQLWLDPGRYYPSNQPENFYGEFFHTDTVDVPSKGTPIFVNSKLYALSFDDQGNQSSFFAVVDPKSVTVTLGPWGQATTTAVTTTSTGATATVESVAKTTTKLTGAVDFAVNGTFQKTIPVGTDGTAVFATTLKSGDKVTATYRGDDNFLPSRAQKSFAVVFAATKKFNGETKPLPGQEFVLHSVSSPGLPDVTASTNANGLTELDAPSDIGTFMLELIPTTTGEANQVPEEEILTLVPGQAVPEQDFIVPVDLAELVTPTEDRFAPRPNPDVATSIIHGLYQDVLDRDGSAQEVANWVQLMQAGITREQAADAFWGSLEHRQEQVQFYYSAYLGRPAEPGGLASWSNALFSGALDERGVVVGLLTSAEYTARHPDNVDFVQSVYQILLNRSAEAGGLQSSLEIVQDSGRAADVRAILDSAETRLDVIDTLYFALLQRLASAQERAAWLEAMNGSEAPLRDLATDLLASDEYFQAAAMAVG